MAGYPFELPPRMVAEMAATDAREAREHELAQLERQDRAWTAARMNEAAEHAFQFQTGHSSAEYREAMGRIAVAKEARDVTAEYGSATRAAILIDGRELKPREQANRHHGGDSARQDALLVRAREAGADPLMTRLVAEFDQRQEIRRQAEQRSELARLEADAIAEAGCAYRHPHPGNACVPRQGGGSGPRRGVPMIAR
jgi:hypothetical protein